MMRSPTGTGSARHADDWLMTYADIITLLLCLFTVLLALRGTSPHSSNPATPPAALPITSSTASVAPMPPTIAPLRELADMPRPIADTDADSDAEDSAGTPPVPASRQSHAAAPQSATQATQAAPEPATPVSGPMPPAQPAAAPAAPPSPPLPAGDRITTFQFDSAAFFASGSATLSFSGESILSGLLPRLQSAEFAAYRITVEGHTDDDPIRSTQYPSNWELSAARAAAVVRFCIEHGIAEQRLRAAGYADTHPLAPNRDPAGRAIPANQAKNRRVVIELEKIEPVPH